MNTINEESKLTVRLNAEGTDAVLPVDTQDTLPDLILPTMPADQQAYLLKGLQGATNTQVAYASDLKQYRSYCQGVGQSPLPASPALLGQYASSLAPNRKWATIARHLASIAKWHALHGLDSPLADRWLRATLDGIQRQHGTEPRQAKVFKLDHIKGVCRSFITERIVKDQAIPRLVDLRDKVVVLLGFLCAFRRSELVSLDLQHVAFTDDGVTISYYASKTNQRGGREDKALFYSSDPLLCPVRLLRRWIALTGRTVGPLLVRVEKGNWLTTDRLGPVTIDKIVKRRLGSQYSAHSLRASFVTISKLAGAQDSEIMQQTGHKTAAMIRRYTRLDSIREHNAVSKIGW